MTSQFGPWATLIDAGANPQLSAFWRRRLTMLVPASQTSPVLSRCNLLCLGLALVLTCALPTFRSASVAAEEEKPAGEANVASASAPAAAEQPDKSGPAPAVAKEPDQKPTRPQVEVEVESTDRRTSTWTLPDGTTMYMSTATTFTTAGEKGRYEEMKGLIAQKKYKFLKTFESPSGEKQYVYRFTFPDGSHMNTNFSMPLEGVASWEDYERKRDEQQRQRCEKLYKAIAEGKFRLINLDVMQIHLCRDVDSAQQFKVQRIPLPDGTEMAFPKADFAAVPASVKETSWQEHLQAIREGKRELLDLETVRSYTYEMLLDDGTTTIFNYGGGEPLKMPEPKDP